LTHASAACTLLALFQACGGRAMPTQPSALSATGPRPADVVSIEGEAGSGDGQVKQRSRASGGQTIHLGPGERRSWIMKVGTSEQHYTLAVTYSNGQEGENEIIRVMVDGSLTRSFQNRNSGDSIEGWNLFVTDPAGDATLRTGSHTIALEVEGGDGCVEIDRLTLTPAR
jgi:hypothetical protein